MKIAAFLLAFLIWSLHGAAQIEEVVEVDLVEVYVSVLDSKGRPVENLEESHFLLKEDGRPQQLKYFSRLLDPASQIPLTIAFLVDTSGSMHKGNQKLRRIDVAKSFAGLFLKEVKPQDMIRIYAFDNVYRALTPMTSDFGTIQKALQEVTIDATASPGTGLLFSVDLTINQLEQYPGRKIMIICSDGQNNLPGPNVENLVEQLKRRDITVLSVATVTDLDRRQVDSEVIQIDGPEGSIGRMNARRDKTPEAKEAERLMKTLAEETGGYAFFPKNDSKLNEVIHKLRSVIHSQYALTYKPNLHSRKGWRKIEVECKNPDAKLRYRRGYFVD